MKSGINVVIGVLVVLAGPPQLGGQSSASTPGSTPGTLPSHIGTLVSPDTTEDPGNEVPLRTHNLTSRGEAPGSSTESPQSQKTVSQINAVSSTQSSATPTNLPFVPNSPSSDSSSSAAAEGLSSTVGGPLTTPLHTPATVSSQPASAGMGVSSMAPTSASQWDSESFPSSWQTTGRPLTSAPGRAPTGLTRHQAPSELNVGDEELKRYQTRSRLDPLLAGLLSVFIVSTAIAFVILFLKFRQRTNHPEFHRLQDLPMDDLMEDTPLSRYSH